MIEVFANSGDTDQTPSSAASDLGLHCLPITLLGLCRLQWDKGCPWKQNILKDKNQSLGYIETLHMTTVQLAGLHTPLAPA